MGELSMLIAKNNKCSREKQTAIRKYTALAADTEAHQTMHRDNRYIYPFTPYEVISHASSPSLLQKVHQRTLSYGALILY